MRPGTERPLQDDLNPAPGRSLVASIQVRALTHGRTGDRWPNFARAPSSPAGTALEQPGDDGNRWFLPDHFEGHFNATDGDHVAVAQEMAVHHPLAPDQRSVGGP